MSHQRGDKRFFGYVRPTCSCGWSGVIHSSESAARIEFQEHFDAGASGAVPQDPTASPASKEGPGRVRASAALVRWSESSGPPAPLNVDGAGVVGCGGVASAPPVTAKKAPGADESLAPSTLVRW